MTEKQKVEVRLSEVKKGLNELGSKPELTDEDRTQFEVLKKEYGDLEVRYQALTISEGEPEKRETKGTPAERERTELEARCNVGSIFASVMEHRATEGAERELQTELGLSDNQIPLCLIETRAITPAPGNVGQDQATIVPAVFPMGAASFLGVDMPTVKVGEAVYPVLTNNTPAADVAEAGNVAETTGSFSAEVLTPRRIQASFFYSREDRARFAGMDEALRMNLNDALSSGLDKYILTKTDLGLLEFGTDPTADGTTETFATYRTALFAQVDGRYAMTAADVCMLVGGDTFAHMALQYRGNNADDSALDSLMRVSGGVRVSAHVPDQTNGNVQQAVIARGKGYRHAVAPIWEGIQLIPDEVTKAASGEIVITAVMLMNFKVIRTAGFKRLAFDLG